MAFAFSIPASISTMKRIVSSLRLRARRGAHAARPRWLVARKKRQGQYRLPGFIFYDHHKGRIVVYLLSFLSSRILRSALESAAAISGKFVP